MAILTGTSKEMEEQARRLSDAELAEIAWMNDSAQALKARGEIARRSGEAGKSTLLWARIAGWAAIIATILAVIGIAAQLHNM